MTMHMMPVYYTSNNTRKRKPTKNKRILAARAADEEFLRKHGCHPEQLKTKPKKFVEWKGHEHVYRRETKFIPSRIDTVGINGCAKKDNSERLKISSNYTIAPAYNKGAYQVIMKENVKDIGK